MVWIGHGRGQLHRVSRKGQVEGSGGRGVTLGMFQFMSELGTPLLLTASPNFDWPLASVLCCV